jgi:hypothetical protein
MNRRALSVFFYIASALAMVACAAASDNGPGIALPDDTMGAAQGTNTETQEVAPNSTCSAVTAVPPQVSGDDCPGNCVQVGPPLPCIMCTDDALGKITQMVPSGGNFAPLKQTACGNSSLGGCVFNNNNCLCLQLVPNGVCGYSRSMGPFQAKTSPGS